MRVSPGLRRNRGHGLECTFHSVKFYGFFVDMYDVIRHSYNMYFIYALDYRHFGRDHQIATNKCGPHVHERKGACVQRLCYPGFVMYSSSCGDIRCVLKRVSAPVRHIGEPIRGLKTYAWYLCPSENL
jgi:hypothetical protein